MALHQYSLSRCEVDKLKQLEKENLIHTVFLTEEWIRFLMKNQNAEPVILQINDGQTVVAYFVGMVVKKFGLRIFGSPFEGWLTCDMGFIRVGAFDVNEALRLVADYAMKTLHCCFVQIYDKQIREEELDAGIKRFTKPMLQLDIAKPEDEIMQNFTKFARTRIRLAGRRLTFEKVPFDREFVDVYFDQLEEVFKRQKLYPTYDREKLYDLAEALKDRPELVLAEKAYAEDGACMGTILTFGLEKWAYYLCAANVISQQNGRPSEGLFWEFVKHWNDRGMEHLDLVGYREYKLRYSPAIEKEVYVYFEKFPGFFKMKSLAAKTVGAMRTLKGKILLRNTEEKHHDADAAAGSD